VRCHRQAPPPSEDELKRRRRLTKSARLVARGTLCTGAHGRLAVVYSWLSLLIPSGAYRRRRNTDVAARVSSANVLQRTDGRTDGEFWTVTNSEEYATPSLPPTYRRELISHANHSVQKQLCVDREQDTKRTLTHTHTHTHTEGERRAFIGL